MVTINHNTYLPYTVETKLSTQMIDVFSSGNGERDISLDNSSKLTYLFIATGDAKVKLSLGTIGSPTHLDVWGLCLATPGSDIQIEVKAKLSHDLCTTNIHIVSFLMEGSACNVDGGLIMEKGIHEGVGHLLEETILLGEDIQIRTLPMLDVQSSDVKASHGATIQRLDEEKLFYLTSKGIPLPDAKRLMISSYFDKLFEAFGDQQEIIELKEHYLQHVLQTL